MKLYLRYWPWLFFILIFLGGYGIAYFQRQSQKEGFAERISYKVPASCSFNSDPCTIEIDGEKFYIQVQGNVAPLERFKIQLQGDVVQSAVVSMSMIDMDMGVNHYVFKQTAVDLFEASVVLPVCTARRKDWLAEFYIDLMSGDKINIIYPFNTR